MKKCALLIFLAAIASSQTPAAAPVPLPASVEFALAGYGTKINGTLGYGQLVTQASQTYIYTAYRFVPVRGTLAITPAILTGPAVHLRDFGPIHGYGLAQGGATSAAGSVLGVFDVGGFAIIAPAKWKHFGILLGADMQKTAGGASYPNFDAGLVFHP